MKKVLFASTALVLAAGVASADVKVKGKAQLGIKDAGNGTQVVNDIDIDIVGSASTDNGLSLGASVDIDADEVDSSTTKMEVNDPEVYVAMGDTKLTVGQLDGAMDRGGIADVGFDGIGVDNVAEVALDGQADHDVMLSSKIGDVSVAVSVDSVFDDWAIGASGTFGDVSYDVAFGEAGNADQFLVALGYTSGAFGVKVSYEEDSTPITGSDAIGLELSYTTGDVTVTGVFADDSVGGEAWGLGVAYDMGGATLAGAFGEVNGSSRYDLGLTFAF